MSGAPQHEQAAACFTHAQLLREEGSNELKMYIRDKNMFSENGVGRRAIGRWEGSQQGLKGKWYCNRTVGTEFDG